MKFLLSIITLVLLANISIAQNTLEDKNVKVLAASSIFEPLIADPKYPRFTLAYHYYNSGLAGHHNFSPNLGASLPLAVYENSDGRKFEIGIHAGVFSTMDIGSNPTRLINSDYFGGVAFAVKDKKYDYLLRIAHTSSHIGDEFLLSKDGKKIKRVNLSYETAEGVIGYNFDNGLRPYLGVGYIIHAEPNSYRTAEFIFGADYRHPDFYLDGYARPIAGIYSKTSKNFGWHPNISIKAGIEFKEHFTFGKKLQLLMEYYNGNSIHGQFYKKREHYFGPSINVNF